MSIDDEVRLVLETAGYYSQAAKLEASSLEFEDEAILGFVAIYGTVQDLLATWERDHDRYLRTRIREVRGAADKTSNLYGVFIAEGDAHREQLAEIHAIEENFIGSRKMVGVNVRTREDVRGVLLPLLPIQSASRFTPSDLDARLSTRLDSRSGLYTLLSGAQSAEDLVSGVLAK
jgi:hypothetical protein